MLAVAFLAFMSISVDLVVDAVAEDVVRRTLVPGFDALIAAGGAIRKIIRGLLAHDQLIIGLGIGLGFGLGLGLVHTRLLLPHEVADFCS